MFIFKKKKNSDKAKKTDLSKITLEFVCLFCTLN